MFYHIIGLSKINEAHYATRLRVNNMTCGKITLLKRRRMDAKTTMRFYSLFSVATLLGLQTRGR